MSLYNEDNNNDRYLMDMELFSRRKGAWSSSHPRYKLYRNMVYIVIGLGCVAIGVVFYMTKDLEDTLANRLPLFVAIWVTMLVTYLAGRVGKNKYEHPFHGLHNARFEASDYGLFYIYQLGMTLVTYYIKDKNIKEIIRDDECNVIEIIGEAETETMTRKGTTEATVDKLYALVTFDEYDLDDLLEPYGDLVTNAPGTLRLKYVKEYE